MALTGEDAAFLDDVFDATLARLASGGTVDPEDYAHDREDLAAAIAATVRLAQEIAVRRPEVWPRVPGFSIVGELGRGGMGTVYLARQERLGGRLVALKVAPALAAHEPRTRARFLSEARAMARVRHANIVEIHDVVDERAVVAYAMEWVDGLTLADVVRCASSSTDPGSTREIALERLAQRLDGEVAETIAANPRAFFVRAGLAIARALEAVHAAGIVHRDVKPSNVLIRRNGTCLLADFGVALADGARSATRTGTFRGTVAYAAPEQLRGERRGLDARADVYGLGATLLHALTGRLRHGGRTPTETLAAIELDGSLDPRRLAARVPLDLATIVAKAVEPAPERRYDSAADLAEDLERLLALRPIRARPPSAWSQLASWLRRRRATLRIAMFGAALALLLAAVAAGLASWTRARSERELALARGLLLHPGLTEELYVWIHQAREPGLTASTGVAVESHLVERYDAALDAYARAARFAPFDARIRSERGVVGLARELHAGAAPTADPSTPIGRYLAHRRGAPSSGASGNAAATLADLRPSAARELGLLAYLLGDIDTCTRAWDLAPDDEDPLRNAIRGLVELGWRRPESAYAFLEAARRGLPASGPLHLYLADSALRLGRSAECEHWLARARDLEFSDPLEWADVVAADLQASRGELDHALRGYSLHRSRHASPRARLHAAALYLARGEAFPALQLAFELVRTSHGPWYAGELLPLLETWWARLSEHDRHSFLAEAAGDPDGLGRNLAVVLDAVTRADIERLAAGQPAPGLHYGAWRVPAFLLESWGLANRSALPAPRHRAPTFRGLILTCEALRSTNMMPWMTKEHARAVVGAAWDADRELDPSALLSPRSKRALARVSAATLRALCAPALRAAALCATSAALLGPASGQFVLDFQFDQDGVLPSSHPLVSFSQNTGVSEIDTYSASNGLLHQETVSLSGFARYDTTMMVLDPELDLTVEARLSILSIQGQGVFVQAIDGVHRYQLGIIPDAIEVVSSTGQPSVDIDDLSSFHTYRLESSGGSGDYRLYIDDVFQLSVEAQSFPSLNQVAFGDGVTPAGNGADAEWDFIRFEQRLPVPPVVYCTAKTTSNGCVPAIGWTGKPLASLTGGFHVTAVDVINAKNGLLFFGLSGRAALPFQGGTLCVQPPLKRGPVLNSGGSAPPAADCSGTFDLDFDAWAASPFSLPAFATPGTTVDAQWWGRDPGFAAPNDTLLSDAIEFTLQP